MKERSNLSPILIAGIGVALMAPGLIFLAARIALPSDGTQIQFEGPLAGAEGLPVARSAGGSQALRTGDEVLAVEGRPLEEWVARALSLRWEAPRSGSLTYRVERDGRERRVTVSLGRTPLGDLIRREWSNFLYLGYLLMVDWFVFIRRPRLPAAQGTMLLGSVIFGTGAVYFMGLQASDLATGGMVALWFVGTFGLYGLMLGGLLHFALIFPHRWEIMGRRRWLPAALYLGTFLPMLAYAGINWPEATTLPARLGLLSRGTGVMTAINMPAALTIAILGYRRVGSPSERKQLRWIMWGALIAILPWLVLSVIPGLLAGAALIPSTLTGLFWLAIPTTFAIAILREKLFDIDIIIHRTLVYGVLSTILALLYFLGVTTLQAAFRQLTGGTTPLAIVATTLGVASLFYPLRNRVQAMIDKRFYRKKFDAGRSLTSFSDRVREQVELEDISLALLALVQETVQPAGVELWLRDRRRAD